MRYEVEEVNTKQLANNAPRKTTREILKGVSGFAIPGETVFIMGSSGTGKTTLLSLLSLRE